ncbi:hypothetical protein KXD93_24670 [Mucilaginibacter sp. BJC16-A38]|uniref:hypothetical protein n=1 Tax=Mucilaginibacter phenanthrenivorans TaxID=1234842 RepID=UPI00215872CF|nr:hypothetical protein [Mucilaginibacter phenanthrenivorans]MCR8560874.1 hypothetical protein [Mucilaginibacter phenanthrenivorans]MDP9076510.1 hypothetical protein [Bacteroidota bacterium]
MKTQCINIDQNLLDITNLMITNAKSSKLNKLFFASNFSTAKLGYYLLPLAKQIFKETFMGADMEMGILLIFLQDYFFSATDAIRNNAVTNLFKKIKGSKRNVAVPASEMIYNHPQAA